MPFLSHTAEAKKDAAHLFFKYFDSIHSKVQQESITHLSANIPQLLSNMPHIHLFCLLLHLGVVRASLSAEEKNNLKVLGFNSCQIKFHFHLKYSSRIFKLLIKFSMLNRSSEQPRKGKCIWWLPTSHQNITFKPGRRFQLQQLLHNIQRHFYPGVTSSQCHAAEIHTAGHKSSQQIIPIASLRLALAWMWECGDTGFNPVFWLVEFPAKAAPHSASTLSYTNSTACVRKFVFEFYIKT